MGDRARNAACAATTVRLRRGPAGVVVFAFTAVAVARIVAGIPRIGTRGAGREDTRTQQARVVSAWVVVVALVGAVTAIGMLGRRACVRAHVASIGGADITVVASGVRAAATGQRRELAQA